MSASQAAPSARSRRRWARIIAPAAVLLLLGAGVGWAGATVLAPSPQALQPVPYTSVNVRQGDIGATLSLNTSAEWTLQPLAANQAAGTVTSVRVGAGQELQAGDVLYAVDLRPVVVAQGDVPMFRPLSEGTTGDDVAQLQTFLRGLGLYKAGNTGTYNSVTTAAVKAWQKSLQLPQDGSVQRGDLLFVPNLPLRASLDEAIVKRGANLAGGEPVLSGLSSSPNFKIAITDSQSSLLATGKRVEVTSPSGALWEAFITDRTKSDAGLFVNLSGKDGTSICADACSEVPVEGEALFSSKVVIVEQTTGLIVPSSALVTGNDGSIAVVSLDGTRYPVQVTASAQGMSVINGVDEGLEVRIPSKGN